MKLRELRQIIREEIRKTRLNENNETKSLNDFIEEYITDIDEFMNDDWFILDGKNVMFTIPYTENFSSESPAKPSEDVDKLVSLLQQKGIKILKKGIMKDGGDKYTEIKVNYEQLRNKL
jgi:glutamate mutase epsilon subunit